MKVLHLINSLERGGVERWLLSMLKTVPRDPYLMDVCCRGVATGSLTGEAQSYGAQVIHCRLGPAHIGFYRQLKNILLSGNYDLLHNHAGVYSGFVVWIANQCGVPAVTSFHNTRFAPQTQLTQRPIVRHLRLLYSQFSIRYALRHSAIVTGCSQDVLNVLDDFDTQSRNRRKLLYYGVDFPEPATSQQRSRFRESFGWQENTPILIHVGRFFEQKNHVGLITIFKEVCRQIPDARLLLVGDGPLRSDIEQLVRQQDLSDNVRFLGLRDDVSTLLTSSDLFMMPSLFEGLPVAALEAQAAGLPIVGTRTVGLAEAVIDGETALLYDLNEHENMARTVVDLIQQPEKARQIGAAGRNHVHEHFSTHASANHLMAIYDECHSLA